jgi:hypothetical protein
MVSLRMSFVDEFLVTHVTLALRPYCRSHFCYYANHSSMDDTEQHPQADRGKMVFIRQLSGKKQ